MLALCSDLRAENETKTTHQGHEGQGLEASHGSEGGPDSHKARVTTSVGSPPRATATARPFAASPPFSPIITPMGRGGQPGHITAHFSADCFRSSSVAEALSFKESRSRFWMLLSWPITEFFSSSSSLSCSIILASSLGSSTSPPTSWIWLSSVSF